MGAKNLRPIAASIGPNPVVYTDLGDVGWLDAASIAYTPTASGCPCKLSYRVTRATYPGESNRVKYPMIGMSPAERNDDCYSCGGKYIDADSFMCHYAFVIDMLHNRQYALNELEKLEGMCRDGG